jgi:hypothetical protein
MVPPCASISQPCVTLHPQHLEVQIALRALRALLMGDASAGKSGDQDSNEPGPLTSLSIPARLQRTGKEIAIVIDGSGGPTSACPTSAPLRRNGVVEERRISGSS